MTIHKELDGNTLSIALSGELNSVTAPALAAELKGALHGVTLLVFDFAGLKYASSAGLRVILQAQREMNRQGRMIVRNVRESIREVFDVTGFTDILTIE